MCCCFYRDHPLCSELFGSSAWYRFVLVNVGGDKQGAAFPRSTALSVWLQFFTFLNPRVSSNHLWSLLASCSPTWLWSRYFLMFLTVGVFVFCLFVFWRSSPNSCERWPVPLHTLFFADHADVSEDRQLTVHAFLELPRCNVFVWEVSLLILFYYYLFF